MPPSILSLLSSCAPLGFSPNASKHTLSHLFSPKASSTLSLLYIFRLTGDFMLLSLTSHVSGGLHASQATSHMSLSSRSSYPSFLLCTMAIRLFAFLLLFSNNEFLRYSINGGRAPAKKQKSNDSSSSVSLLPGFLDLLFI
ncbi:hypothetical protein BVRB_7g167500 [Beta vulgaris subsp. vulgaris]|nr:hypothetical protein BVRB_7g167500 [Beta vulgaris subsp. vulgaris]